MGVYYIGSIPCSGGDIYHFGRKGMKWGQTIFGDLADRLADRGWGGASRVARGISTGFGRANEFINADNARQAMNYARGSKQAQARSAYNRTLPGMAENARQKAQEAMAKARERVTSAYSKAAESLGNKGLDIQSFYSQVMQKAQGAINQGKDMVRQYGGQFVSQIQNLGSKALEGGKAFLDKAMEKAKQAKSKATEPISRLKARKAEKRDAEYDVGHKSNHDRNLGRERRYNELNRGSGLGPYTPHRDQIIEYYNDYTGEQKSRPGNDDNGNLIGGYKRSKGKPGNKVLDERVRDQYRISRQAYKAVDKKIKKK